METLLHEYLHLWQQQIGFGKDPFKPGKSPHNKEFVEKALAWGVHVMPDVGCHVAVADEPFSLLMREWGIERPEDVPRDARNIDWFKVGRDIQGRSSLAKWTCAECGINVRVEPTELTARYNK